MALVGRAGAHRIGWLATLGALWGCNSSIEVLGPPHEPADAGTQDANPSQTAAHVDKVDLLFVVDNSPSMGDKQQVLALTVPALVERLTNPTCVSASTGEHTAVAGPSASCPAGSEREFPPVTDMHVGVITTSLGGHGADTCADTTSSEYNPHMQDMAHLIDRGPQGAQVSTWQGKGFLDWDPAGRDQPPGQSDAAALSSQFVDMVLGAGEDGCGFEAPLEAWYRFLVDPAPYEKMVAGPCFSGDVSLACRVRDGVDQVLLQQRRDFLRQDSLLSIVMLTDENDCSVTDEQGQAYLVLQAMDGTSPFHVARGTSACEATPNSPDCKSCWDSSAADRPECVAGWTDADLQDPLNLRCYREKQRFGIDFLYPIDRYVAALTLSNLPAPAGGLSPLFCRDPAPDGATCTAPLRDPSQVVLAGIVGVPWQDIARDPTDLGKGFRAATELPWPQVLGSVVSNVEPTDPLMIESVAERTGTNPAIGAAIATPATPPGTSGANPINGFDRPIPGANDLQYACIFDLPSPIDCSAPDAPRGCECHDDTPNPLCWDAAQGHYGTMQFRAKAYPGRRQLAVLQGVESQAVVASICAGELSDPSAASYGYRPFVDALVGRMSWNLSSHPSD